MRRRRRRRTTALIKSNNPHLADGEKTRSTLRSHVEEFLPQFLPDLLSPRQGYPRPLMKRESDDHQVADNLSFRHTHIPHLGYLQLS